MTPPRSGTDTVTTRTTPVRTEVPRGTLEAACERIAPLWPLDHFVAVNPYLGLAEQPFEEALATLSATIGARATLPADFYLAAFEEGRLTRDDLVAALAARPRAAADVDDLLARVRVDGDVEAAVVTVADVATAVTGNDWGRVATEQVAAWAAAYFDTGMAMWRSTDPERPLFAAWREEASIDRTPDVLGLRGFRTHVRDLPDDPVAAAQRALSLLGVPREGLDAYLHRVLLRLGGWASHAAWRRWEQRLRGGDDDALLQLLAVLLCWEAGLLVGLADRGVLGQWQEARATLVHLDPAIAPPALSRLLVLQDAFDRAEQRRLVARLRSGGTAAPSDRPAAQAVFCIDVRSEVLRRHLEDVADDVETLGFAGFFGVPVEYVPLAHEAGGAQCPALLTPSHVVRESLADRVEQGQVEERRRMWGHVRRAWKSFKMGAITCFSFVGPVGLAYLPKLVSDTFGWTRPVPVPDTDGLGRPQSRRGPDLAVGGHAGRMSGIPLEDRVELAAGALRGMSLGDRTAPLVVFAGHGASTVNNPYDTGLHCGACGGHTGEANARIAAAICNDPAVRAGLASRGLEIPDDTVFVAALHDTTTDDVRVFDRHLVPTSHRDRLAELEDALARAGRAARAERAPRLGIGSDEDADTAVRRRSTDWAQVRPEWGLAGCRAFVAAPRHRTRGTDLQGQSFLHEYDWRRDEGFAVLELLLTAPVVVASWISLQYYASTVDNRVHGSGNKVLHNVVGKLGVLEGNAGDLRVGLPQQSVHDGERPQHEPVRLNVVVEAPLDAITSVLATHDQVRALFDNAWLHLLAMGDDGTVSYRYAGDLHWERVDA